jgi:aspartate carbamoyltransferase catalytic subunit
MNIDAMGAAAFVLRTEYSGLPAQIARHISAAVLNAGDGWHEHPTQGLFDLMTIVEEVGELEGKTVTIVGDITHSRVFGSVVRALKKFGATVRVAAPATLQPEKAEEVFGIKTYYSVEEALTGADVVYVLRVQNERGATGDIPTLREYSKAYGISEARLKLAKPGALLMHPGPVQRDIDIHSVLMAIPDSRILRQVENGLAVRKALLWLLTSGPKKTFSRV